MNTYFTSAQPHRCDTWRAHQSISDISVAYFNEICNGYSYSVVQHVANFVDPDDQMEHTNGIEGLLSHAKKKLKQL